MMQRSEQIITTLLIPDYQIIKELREIRIYELNITKSLILFYFNALLSVITNFGV
jgi:hypothetical protein